MRFRITLLAPHLFIATSFMAMFPPSSFGEALLNTFFALPPGLANDVVRVAAVDQNGAGMDGTGTIIAITPDGTGSGNFYCVLTADHVVSGFQRVGMSFGSGTNNL